METLQNICNKYEEGIKYEKRQLLCWYIYKCTIYTKNESKQKITRFLYIKKTQGK